MKGARDFIAPAETAEVVTNCTRREGLLTLRAFKIVAMAAQKSSMSISIVAE